MKSILKKTLVILFAVLIIQIVFTISANAETKTSTGTGNWNTAATWSPIGVPAAGDDIVIASGHTVTIDVNTNSLQSLTINGTLIVGNNITDRTITVTGNILINSGGNFTTTGDGGNILNIGGDFTNNGTFDANIGSFTMETVFNGTANQSVSGTGATMDFYLITINNTGAAADNIVEVQSDNFSAVSNFLALTAGILKISGSFTFSEAFFTTNAYSIPAGSGIWLNNNNVTINGQGASPTLRGSIQVTNGLYNIGTSSGNSLKYYSGSVFTMDGGTVNIAGRFQPNLTSQTIAFNMSDGILTIADVGHASSTYAGFDIYATGSLFTMSGGTIIIKNANTTTSTKRDYRNTAGTVNISGGTVQFGSATTIGSPNFIAGYGSTASVIPNLTIIQATTTSTVSLNSPLHIFGDLLINSGTTLDANGNDIDITGDWNNAGGIFTSGINITTFNGISDQTISGTNTYYNVVINKTTGNIIIANDNTISNILTFHASNLGNIVTGANELIVGNSASTAINRQGGGHIIGNLQRAIKADANSYLYPLGTTSAYTPVEIDFAAGTLAGSLTGTTIDGDHPDLASSGIDGSSSVNRYWNFTINSGLSTANYNATFNWASADQDAGFDYSNTNAGKLDVASWTYPTMGTLSTNSAQITGVSGFSDFQIGNYLTATISGYFTYFNNDNTPLNGVDVVLEQATSSIQSTTTDANGYYEFTGVNPGDYDMVTDYSEQTGYINSTDAAQANYWAVNPSSIELTQFYAGDVTGDLSVSSGDAGLIQQHFLTLGNPNPSFAAGWAFWTAGEMITANPGSGAYPTVTVLIGETSVTQDFYGLGTGDFNGSFVPGGLKSGGSGITLNYGEKMEVGNNEVFDLPIIAGMDMKVGAISLILEIPSDIMMVNDVYIGNETSATSLYSVFDNELRISWQSAEPLVLQNGNTLLTLVLKLNGSANSNELYFSLADDLLNELADDSFNPIGNAELIVDIISTTVLNTVEFRSGNELTLSNHPNPFKDVTSFVYTLPADGKVTIEIYDIVGNKVKVLTQKNQIRGEYSFKADLQMLKPGLYTAYLKLDSNNDTFIKAIKIIYTQ